MSINSNCNCYNTITAEVNQVFDSSISKHDSLNVTARLTEFSPANPTFPLNTSRIVSNETKAFLTNISTTYTKIQNSRYYRIVLNCIVNIPITAYYIDANNISGIAQGIVSQQKEIFLFVPFDAYLTHTFSTHAILANHVHEIIEGPTFDFTCCLIIILKVIAIVDVVIPICCYKKHREERGSACDRIFSGFPYTR